MSPKESVHLLHSSSLGIMLLAGEFSLKKASSPLGCKDSLENKNPLHILLGINVKNNFQVLMLKLILVSSGAGTGSSY